MAQHEIEVTYRQTDRARIPDELTEGACLFLELKRRGVVAEAGERVRIRRQGGYSGLDVWLFLLLLFTTQARWGIRTLWDKLLCRHGRQLAALAGRSSLISPAALSRALDKVEVELLRPATPWMLLDMPEVDDVLRHPATKSYDACGQGWLVFDIDPTVTTVRHRALPMDDDLPEPRRRSEETVAPGYSGRKRGDMLFRRTTVQHHGSSLWVHGHLSTGNGDGVIDFGLGLDAVAETCDRIGHSRAAALVRMDGEYGNVPSFTACRERRLPFVTRLNRPKLYEDPEILRRLRSATWCRVPDSLAGPQRSAADLGTLRVKPGARTRRPDGSPYEPLDLRVVASIFPTEGEANRGRAIDGWQVELFVADLPADAWPAPESVAAYFGRGAQENRFAQEDRELGLDRIVSYHLPGQEFACVVGLSLWNYQVVQGFWHNAPPAEPPPQPARTPDIDERVPEQWPRDPVVQQALGELDWPSMLVKRAGWRWDTDAGELRCKDGRPLALTSVRPVEHAAGRTGVIFRRPLGGCEACSHRAACMTSTRPLACKHAEFSIPTSNADRLRARLILVRSPSDPPARVNGVNGASVLYDVQHSLVLPATARQDYRSIFLGATLRVVVEAGPEPPPWPRLLALDDADRQRRRKTWQQNVERYALATDTRVRVEVAGSNDLRRLLGDTNPSAPNAARSIA